MRWLPLAMLCAACGVTPLVAGTSEYAVGAERLDFGRAWVGFPAQQRLEILSRTRFGVTVPVSVDAPFAVDVPSVSVGGGDAVALQLRFEPGAAGAFTGVLRVGALEVPLEGVAEAPPTCAAPAPCRSVAFDPVSGTCVEALLADGTACAGDACVEQGQCRAGACVGTAKACDDGDACTRDSCAPATGCVHTDVSAECPAAGDACHAAACDPRSGCTVAPVDDGTPCGSVSCEEANVCMQGRCVAMTPPDGFTCAPSSPCQDRGVCRSRACVQAPPRTLAAAWSYVAPPQSRFLFEGVTDPQQNLWWVECMDGETMSCGAVSYTKSGLPRFRTAAVSGMNSARVAQLFDQGRFVFATINGVVVAVDGATGQELWRTDVAAAVGGWFDRGEPAWLHLTSDGAGRLWLSPAGGWERCGTNFAGVEFPRTQVQLSAATGAILFQAVLDVAAAPVADEQGNLYLTREGSPGLLLSWTPAGVERFAVALDGGAAPVAVSGGRAVLASGSVRSTVAGAELASWGARPAVVDDALFLGGKVLRLERVSTKPLPVVMPNATLVVYDAASPAGRALAAVAGPADLPTSPVAAARETVLVAGRFTPSSAALTAVTTAGAERFRCALEELPLTSWFSSRAAFTGDRFGVVYNPICPACLVAPPPVLLVFDTTGLGVAASGWVAPRGTPGNAGRPQ